MSGDYRYVYEFFFKENTKDLKPGSLALESSTPFDDIDATADSSTLTEAPQDRYANLKKLMNFLKLERLNYTAAGKLS